MRMAQMFIATVQNQQNSAQPSTLYPPRGNQVPFYSQQMHRSSKVSTCLDQSVYITVVTAITAARVFEWTAEQLTLIRQLMCT